MKKISLFTFLNLIFAMSVLLFGILLYIYIKIDKQHYLNSQKQRYTLLLKNIQNMSSEELKRLFQKQFNAEEIANNRKKSEILEQANKLMHTTTLNTTVDILNYKDKIYIYVKNYNLNVIFQDDPMSQYDFSKIIIAALGILLLLALLYFLLLLKLRPLKILNNNITKFKKGDFSIHTNIDSQDEIGAISENFNQAIENIRYLIESKHLFMRNIMHELKTPITKALFLANMIQTDNKKEKEELVATLYDMNNIVKELANIDKFQSQFSNLLLESIDIQELIETIKKELQSENIIVQEHEKLELIANKELFYTALKNLIENGIKYSSDQTVIVDIYSNRVTVSSKGEELKKSLEYYTQPFTQEKKSQKGYGLGLYIASEILKLHHFNLKYHYRDGYNCFSINIESH